VSATFAENVSTGPWRALFFVLELSLQVSHLCGWIEIKTDLSWLNPFIIVLDL